MQLTANAQVLDAVVRMVVPMRREFGCLVDVQAFMRNASYAQQVLAQALTSREQRLRSYAERAQVILQPAPAKVAPSAPAVAPAPRAPAAQRADQTDFAAQRRTAVQRLLQLVGPAAEPLCIRIEKAPTANELAPLLKLAQQVVANQHGDQVARDYLASVGLRDAATR